MTIKHLFPPAWPTLNLDFANSKALDPRITFSRSSIGTYVDAEGIIQTAADDEPRFDHDPETGESLGLLIEESRTNSIVQSQALDTPPWFSLNGTIASSTELSPDGTANAYRLTASSNECYNRYIITNAGSDYTFSAFIKAGNVNWVRLYVFGRYVDFDLHNVTVGFVATGITGYGIDQVADGWVRCWASTASTSVTQVRIYPLVDSNDLATSPGDYIDLYGAQLEENATFPTSYIPTSGSTATRAVDLASVETSPWYNDSVGSFYAEAGVPFNDTLKYVYAGRDDIFNVNLISLNVDSIARLVSRLHDSTGVTKVLSLSPRPPAQLGFFRAKHVFAYSSGDSNAALDGNITVTSPNEPFIRSGPSSISFGDLGNGQHYLNGHISRFAYYPRRLTDEQLQALTS